MDPPLTSVYLPPRCGNSPLHCKSPDHERSGQYGDVYDVLIVSLSLLSLSIYM